MSCKTRHERESSGAAPDVISVAIIEDQLDIREGLAALMDDTAGFRCAGRFRSMEQAIAGIKHDLPDVALVDIGLPGMSGIEGLRILRDRHPSMPLLVLTVYEDDERIFDALCAGATGYLLKNTPSARLLQSLQEALAGGAPMSPEVAHRVVELFRRVRPPASADYDLTPHETRVLKLLVEGYTYKNAAARIGVSVNTIAFHIKRIYEKLHVHSKSEAVSTALRAGLIE